MTSRPVSRTLGRRIVGPEPSPRRNALEALLIVAVGVALAVVGRSEPMVLFAVAGAGAGHSLSGSV